MSCICIFVTDPTDEQLIFKSQARVTNGMVLTTGGVGSQLPKPGLTVNHHFTF
jgi:hypothetical protein